MFTPVKRKFQNGMCKNVFIAFFVASIFLTGCNMNAGKVYDAIKPEFYKDYPGATIVNMVPDMHHSLAGLLGYEVNLRITFKRNGNSQEETVVWDCFCHKDKGWIVKKKSV
jgi:hypothetical protein